MSSCEEQDISNNAEKEKERLEKLIEIINCRIFNLQAFADKTDPNLIIAYDFENLARIESKLIKFE